MKWSNRKKRKRKSKGSIETIIFFQRLTKACSLSCTILRRRLVQGTRSLRIGTCHSCGRPCFSPGRKGGSLHLQAKDNQPPRPRDIKDPVPASRATIYLPAHPLSSPTRRHRCPQEFRSSSLGGCTMTLGYDISDVSHTVYGSTSSMSTG